MIPQGILQQPARRAKWWAPLSADVACIVHPSEYTTIAQLSDDANGANLLQSNNATAIPAVLEQSGIKGVYFNGTSQDLISLGAAAQYAFLNSGECLMAFRMRALSALNTQTLFTTWTSGGAQTGVRVFYNGGTRTFWFQEYNAGALVLSCQSPNLGTPAPPQNFDVVFRVNRAGAPNCELYVNRVLLQTAAYTGANGGTPDQTLTLSRPTSGNFANLILKTLLLSSVDPGAAGVSGVFDILENAESTRSYRNALWFGDSITESAAHGRRQLQTAARTGEPIFFDYHGTRPPTGNFPLVNKNHDGVSGNTLQDITARVVAYVPSGTETDIVLLGGTNSLVPRGSAGSLEDLATCGAAIAAKFPGRRYWIFELTYGDGTNPVFTAGGAAGEFNAGINAVIASLGGARVGFRKIPIHAAGGATTYIWNPLTDAQDSVGHETVLGGNVLGNAAAQFMSAT